jgi:DNA-binding XRE family transcriptional regulator
MSETNRPSDELEDYLATFSLEERKEYRAAETVLDLANLLYHIRYTHGSTQYSAAERSGLKQQAISRLEQAASNMQLGTLQLYLGALGYHLETRVIDDHAGKVAGKTSFSRL